MRRGHPRHILFSPALGFRVRVRFWRWRRWQAIVAAKCKKSEIEGARVALCCSLAFTGRERGERLVSALGRPFSVSFLAGACLRGAV